MGLSKLRAKVERLLRRDIRVGDLTDVFLEIRETNFGREWIRELGDFVAHGNQRNRGVVTQAARNWLLVAKYYSWVRPHRGKPVDLTKRPPFYTEFLRASYELMDEGTIEQATGMKPRATRKLLEEIIKKFVPRSDGDLSFSGQPSWDEFALLKHLSTIIVMKHGFDGKQLIEDFTHVLQRNKALCSDEDIGFLQSPLCLFAISKMHGTTLALSKTEQISLSITTLDSGPMSIGVDFGAVGYAWVPSWFFSSRLNAREHCEPSLIAHPLPWNFAVEVNQNLKLEKLG